MVHGSLNRESWASWAGPNEYPRVLDYSIFKSLLVPYSENFTTRSSSRVVVMFTFFVKIIEISRKWKSDTFMMDSCITPNNYNNVHVHLSLNLWTGISCGSSGLVSTHCTPWCGRLLGVLEAVCKLSVLTISKIHTHSGFWVGWHHSFHVTAWSDSDWITHTDVQLWHSTTVTFLESIYCSYQMYFSFKISSAPKWDFLGMG